MSAVLWAKMSVCVCVFCVKEAATQTGFLLLLAALRDSNPPDADGPDSFRIISSSNKHLPSRLPRGRMNDPFEYAECLSFFFS